MESSEEDLESGESEPAGSKCEPANIDAESDESKDEVPYVFSRGSPAQVPEADPVDRAVQLPTLTYATAPAGRVPTLVTISEGGS